MYCDEQHRDFFPWIMDSKGHNQEIMNDKRPQFSIVNIMYDIVYDKKGHNIVNDSL